MNLAIQNGVITNRRSTDKNFFLDLITYLGQDVTQHVSAYKDELRWYRHVLTAESIARYNKIFTKVTKLM